MRNLAGNKFGRLTVLERNGTNKWGGIKWLCQCECGKLHIVASQKLIQGKTTSCGCYKRELKVKQLEKHGITTNGKPRTFTIWNGIKARCLNPKDVNYKNYGGRGIGICDEWKIFENFHNWALISGYNDSLTIDRIDNNGNYEPSNCRWIDRKQNLLNQRRYIIFDINGKKLPLSTFAREMNISRHILSKYYKKHGKMKTEKVINECMNNNKGQIYFVNKFLCR